MDWARAYRWGQTLAAAILAAGLLTACDEGNAFPITCDRPESDLPTDYRQGGIVDGVYWTSDWDMGGGGAAPVVEGEPLYYPGGAYYKIWHNLGKVPDWWLFYLSFEQTGMHEGKVALASGNMVEVAAIDACTITILNGTCTQYWLIGRVGQQAAGGASGAAEECVGPAGGAGGD